MSDQRIAGWAWRERWAIRRSTSSPRIDCNAAEERNKKTDHSESLRACEGGDRKIVLFVS